MEKRKTMSILKVQKIGSPEDYVEFLEFNYDGKGSSIARYPGSNNLEHLSLGDTEDILFGVNGKNREYELADKK